MFGFTTTIGSEPPWRSRAVPASANGRPEAHRVRFIYAPPYWDGEDEHERARYLPTPPYPKAPSHERSVYFYWWSFLRESKEYRDCCDAQGKGALSKLYTDFGDIFATDFRSWWEQRGCLLFCEPGDASVIELDHLPASHDPASAILVSIPRVLDVEAALKQLQEILGQSGRPTGRVSERSRARYPVASPPKLPNLHLALAIWRASKKNPEASNWELLEQAGLMRSQFKRGDTGSQSRVTQAVSRAKLLAKKLISCVEKGVFPLPSGTAVEKRPTPARLPPNSPEAADVPSIADTGPRALACRDALARRRSALSDRPAHMIPLLDASWLTEVSTRGEAMEDLDPYSAGTGARVLIVVDKLPLAQETKNTWDRSLISLSGDDDISAELHDALVGRNGIPFSWCLMISGDVPFVFGGHEYVLDGAHLGFWSMKLRRLRRVLPRLTHIIELSGKITGHGLHAVVRCRAGLRQITLPLPVHHTGPMTETLRQEYSALLPSRAEIEAYARAQPSR
jgi:hypothetical protein